MNSHFFSDLFFYRSQVFSRFLKSLGILFTIDKLLGCFDFYAEFTSPNMFFGIVIILLSSLWAIWFLLKKKQNITLKINKRTKLSVCYGDIFTENGIRVIPVNEYFDTHLGDGIVATNTLHGKFLSKYYNCINDVDEKIREQLFGIESLPQVRQRNMVQGLPQDRYPLGTTIRIEINGQYYLLVAVTRFNQYEHVDVDDSEYMGIMQKMFYHIEQLNNGNAVCLPLIGSGQAGFGYTNMQLLNMMIQAAALTDRLSVVNGIRVILYGSENMKKEMNFSVIKSLYDYWKIL